MWESNTSISKSPEKGDSTFKAFQEQVYLLILSRKHELAEKVILGWYFSSHGLDLFLTHFKLLCLVCNLSEKCVTQVIILYHKSFSWSDNMRNSCSPYPSYPCLLSLLMIDAESFFSNLMPAWLFSNLALWNIFHRRRCIHVQRRCTESTWLLFHLTRLSLLPLQDSHGPWAHKIWQYGPALRGGAISPLVWCNPPVTLNWERDLDVASIEAAAPTNIPSPVLCWHKWL